MRLEQIFTSCLAEMAYYVESKGEAVVIDPLRDIEEYLKMAKEDNAKIKYIFLTHFHADFMAGHQDLAAATGATIVFGPTEAPIGYTAHVGSDGELFNIGDVQLKMLHTPGHTTESMSLLLTDEKGEMHCVFSGDALFLGDVCRPDLAQKVVADLTEDKLARMSFNTIRNVFMPLPDHLIVYPNHGAGSPCGKNMSTDTYDTLGNQKKTNYAMNLDLSEDEYVAQLLDGLSEPPAYFPAMVIGNIKGTQSIYDVRKNASNPLTVDEFAAKAKEDGVVILDTRASDEFVKGFVPGSINIDANGSFAIWVGTILRDVKIKILLVTDKNEEDSMIDRLARVGFDGVQGYLSGGFVSWNKDTDKIECVKASDLTGDENIVDVRRNSEFFSEHVEGAFNAPLNNWWDSMKTIDTSKKSYLHCKSGNRSTIYSSLLKRNGYDNFVNIKDSFENIKGSDKVACTDYVCPTTML